MGSFSVALTPHVDTPTTLVAGIDVSGERMANGVVCVRFVVAAALGSIVLPDRKTPVRAAGLWQRTCFEAFVRLPGARDYAEFNFSPSSQWAAYRFDDYRMGMADLWLESVPLVGLAATRDATVVDVELTVPTPWTTADIDVALSAVIAEADGTKSYWALAHPPGAPDFHHPDCFALTLAAPEAP